MYLTEFNSSNGAICTLEICVLDKAGPFGNSAVFGSFPSYKVLEIG
jgi:hypothetical protein